MKKTIFIFSALALCLTAFAQTKESTLAYEMSDDIKTTSLSTVTVGDSLFTIVGSTGIGGNVTALMPGYANGQIRGNGGFITIVDGVERSASYLRPEEIESVTVLKDAAALAAYGLRGANGALIVKTKMGYEGPTRITADYHFIGNTIFRQPQMASSPEYCMAVNEALINDGLSPRYSLSDINALANGTSIFANNDWQNLLSRNFSSEHRLTLTAEGHEKGIRFFVLANYTGSVGHMNNTGINDGYTTQALSSALSLRTNFQVMLTKTTQLSTHLSAYIAQDQSGNDQFSAVYSTPSFVMPLTTEDGYWITTQSFSNPYKAQCGGGYNVVLNRRFNADITLDQDLSMVTKGLKAQLMLNYDILGTLSDSHGKNTFWYQINYNLDPNAITESYTLTRYGEDTGSTFSGPNQSELSNRFSGWLKVDWARQFDKHDVKASALFEMERFKGLGSTNISSYMNGILHAHYGYDNRYIVDFTGNLSNSGKVNNVTFLPAVSAAWVASNEAFLRDASWLDHLKIKGSWGITGWDSNLAYDMDKRFNNLHNGGGYVFIGSSSAEAGSKEGDLATPYVLPELEYKSNVGVEMTVLGGLALGAEGYYYSRRNMQSSSSIKYSSLLGVGYPTIFDGYQDRWGVDLNLGYTGRSGDWKYNALFTVTWADGSYTYIPEADNPNNYQFLTGHKYGASYILDAVGFYTPEDFNEDGSLKDGVVSSGLVSSLQPGDVKYADKNGDNVIDANDFFYSDKYNTISKWVYGLNLGFSYKNFGVQAIFEAKTGFYVNTTLANIYQPLVNDTRNISVHYLKNYWREGNEANARYPRLTTLENAHNNAASSVWMEKGDFFKLRTLYVYYDFRGAWMGPMKAFRVYARGGNLFSIDHIKIFDPENISLGYPATRSFEIGAKVTF